MDSLVLAPAVLPRSWLQHQALLALQQVGRNIWTWRSLHIRRSLRWHPEAQQFSARRHCELRLDRRYRCQNPTLAHAQLDVGVPLTTIRDGRGAPVGQYQLTLVAGAAADGLDDILIGRASQGTFIFQRSPDTRRGLPKATNSMYTEQAAANTVLTSYVD